jgi:hypothetical protein
MFISASLLLIYIAIFIVAPILLMKKLREDAIKNPMHRSRVALLWGLGPMTLFVGNLISYSVTSFLGYAMGVDGIGIQIFGVLKVLQSIFGIVYMILIPVGIIVVIVIATRDHKPPTAVA